MSRPGDRGEGPAGCSQSDRGHLNVRLAEVEGERQRLVAAGVLLPADSAVDAAERCRRTHDDRGHAVTRLQGEVTRTEQAIEALAGHLDAARKLLGDRRTEAGTLEDRWKQACAERAALQADPVLRAALELEEPDLDRIGEDTLHTLDGRARQEQERVVEKRLLAATDERAVLHIEEHGLLPPSGDAQRVLATLRARLGAAWSGWTWIANNVAKASARDVVRRAPYLAQGVVVRPGDLDRALKVLREAAIEPDAPVVIAGPEAFDSPPHLPGEVAGPGEAAWFDKDAAQRRLAELQQELEKNRREIGEAEKIHRALIACREALRAFRTRFPVGWFATARAALDRAGIAVEESRASVESLEGTRREKEDLGKRLRRELEDARARLDTARSHSEMANRFSEQTTQAERWREDLAATNKRESQAAEEAEQWTEVAAVADARAETARADAAQRGEDARVFEEERKGLRYVEGAPSPQPGPLDEFREHYRQLLAEYEEKIGAESLLALATDKEATARQERDKFDRLRPADVSETDVRAAIEGLPEPDRVEEVRQDAEERAASLQGRLGNLKQRTDTAREALEKAQTTCIGLGQVDLGRAPSTPELAEAESTRCTREATAEDEATVKDKAAADQAGVKADRVRGLRREIDSADGRLRDIQENFADVLSCAGQAGERAEAAVLEDAAFADRVSAIEKGLRKARGQWQTLDRSREEATRGLRVWMTDARFERLDASWSRRLQEQDVGELEDRSEDMVEQLQLRREHLEAQIADVDRHRSILVEEVSGVAEEGLKLLRAATNLSRLPDHVPGIGGAQFLRITAQVPDDPAERRARLADLVDELVTTGSSIGGVELVRAAIRRLARPVQVRVLHPDPALDRRTVSIPEMARFSGGEQLTGAILLYCTLARIRARQRGMSRHPSSVLILDNPIGRVSRVQFLELQREVARAMGVQLIYATGVNDHEALRALPNLIRLRNERLDRNSGHRLVELPDGTHSVEGVRIGRRETGSGGGPRASAGDA